MRIRSTGWCLGAVVLVLLGCGGGGGGGDSPTPILPTVAVVTPRVASTLAPTRLTVGGIGFATATAAALAETGGGAVLPMSGLAILRDTQLGVTVPGGTPVGTYWVRITTPAGTNATSAQTVTLSAAPIVTGVSPSGGLNDRATLVTITGTGLSSVTQARIDDSAQTPLMGLSVSTDTRMTARVPAGVAAGTYDVRVTGTGGTNTAGEGTFAARNLIDPDQAGAFAEGWVDDTVTGATGDALAARIYYPALAAGQAAALDTAIAPYPAVVFNHAYKPPLIAGGIDYRAYAWLAGRLASFGYVVISVDMVPNNNLLGTVYGNAKRDADDARAALNHLGNRNANPSDLFFGFVDTAASGIGGHSRGGDASLIASADEAMAQGGSARFQGVFVLGAPSFDVVGGGGRIPFGDFTSVPCLAVGASLDTIAPFVDQQDIYAQAGPSSEVFEIIGGNHSSYTDTGRQLPFDGIATISLTTQHDVCRRYVVAWLGYHVKGQTALFAPYILGGFATMDPRIRNINWK